MVTLRVGIIGAGITGLTLAWRLENIRGSDIQITIFDASSRLGGKILTQRENGFIIEQGPDAFVDFKPGFKELVHDLGMDNEVIHAKPYPAFIVYQNQLQQIPSGLLNFAPFSLHAWKEMKWFPMRARWELLKRLIRNRPVRDDVSVKKLGETLLGNWITEWVLEPIMAGLYGGNIQHLSADFSAPEFFRFAKSSSLKRYFRGHRQRPEREKSIFRSFSKGMDFIVDVIKSKLKNTRFMLGELIHTVEFVQGTGWYMLGNERFGPFDILVITLCPDDCAQLVKEFDEGLSIILSKVSAHSVTTITYATREPIPIKGTGFLIPRVVDPMILACTWITHKWEHRAPEGWSLLRAFVGRGMNDDWMKLDDEFLIQKVWQTCARYSGLRLPYEKCWIRRWYKGIPLYPVGHRVWLETLQKALTAYKGTLILVGSGYRGVGLADCAKQATEVAQHILSMNENKRNCSDEEKKLRDLS